MGIDPNPDVILFMDLQDRDIFIRPDKKVYIKVPEHHGGMNNVVNLPGGNGPVSDTVNAVGIDGQLVCFALNTKVIRKPNAVMCADGLPECSKCGEKR